MSLNINSLNIFFIGLGFFLSGFYIFPSGLPQPAHMSIIFSFLLSGILYNKIKISDSRNLIIFVIYASFINVFFTLLIGDLSYIVSTIYWIFNLILFSVLVNLNISSIKKLFHYLRFIIPTSLIINIVIWAVGAGRYDFNPRYNGYFNDPNQMAFWVLCSCAMGLILFNNLKLKIIIYFLSFFLILLTMSRSSTIGFLVLTLGLFFQHKGRLELKIIFTLIALLVGIASFFILLHFGFLDNIIMRFSEGIESNAEQASDRGFTNLINYPQYLLLGAGQGAFYLYSETGNEIHSTWLGIIFYYGVIGLFLFVSFLFNIYRKLDFAEKIIFLGPMFYGFFTYSARTLVFWFLVSIFLLYGKYRVQL